MSDKPVGPDKNETTGTRDDKAAPATTAKSTPPGSSSPAKSAVPVSAKPAEPVKTGAASSKPDANTKPEPAKPAEPARPVSKPGSTTDAGVTQKDLGRSQSGAMLVGVIGGGALGLVVAYALAWAGLWPQAASEDAADYAALEARVATLETAPDDNTALLASIDTLTDRIGALESDFDLSDARLTADGEAAGASAAEAPGFDPSGLETELAALADRLAALESNPGSSGAQNEALAAVSDTIAALSARLDDQQAAIGTLNAASADTGPAIDEAAVRLPVVLSALENAFARGRTFEAELDALRSIAPDVEVPGALAGAAADGLPRLETLSARFADALPDVLAARPPSEGRDWLTSTGDWLRARLAVRPAGPIEGNSPEAVISRIEAALAARDFIAAETLMGQLPQTMQAGFGDLSAEIALRADADRLLDDVREQALAASGVSAS